MEAKEKAKELVGRFRDLSTKECDCLEYICICFCIGEQEAKQCALICVDEIIKNLKGMKYIPVMERDEFFSSINIINYWQEVKKEIETL
jgi:hypothetical protein